MFTLYYLLDQNGDIFGDKDPQGKFSSLADAQSAATVSHYSIEQSVNGSFSIVFIC